MIGGDMRSLANGLTTDQDSVRVFEDEEAGWLAAEFRMPTETQLQAVDKIDRALRYKVGNREDSTIGFPRSPAEEARPRRTNERRKAQRKALRRED